MTTARRRTPRASTAKGTPAKATSAKRTPAKRIPAKTKTTPAKAKPKTTPAKATTAKQPTSEPATTTSAEGALVLTGPPGLLRTTVSVHNAVGERLAVRGLALHREGHQSVRGSGAALIPPGETADLPVCFRLEPDTPPGDYTAEVEVGGQRRAAVLRVEPQFALRVSPHRVLAEVGRHALTLTVTNEGNVAVPLARLVKARTDDGGDDLGPDVTLTLSSARSLDPATTVTVTAHLTVPKGLDPARRHTARIPVGTADLDVIILPRSPSE